MKGFALFSVVLRIGAASPSPLRRQAAYQSSNETQVNGTSYSLVEVGGRNTLDWRVFLERNEQPASFWHDVPLYPDETDPSVINFVVEIPRWTQGKIEIKRDEALNPIFHDDRDGAPRFVQNIWPHKAYPFLYGSIPQTWESPNFDHEFTGEPGDNDPMDAFDVGQSVGYTGQIKQVKILGGLAVSDGGETDWKMLVLDVSDPIASQVNDLNDLENLRPGISAAYRNWFHTYKIARGDDYIPIIGDTYQNASFAAEKVLESHGFWQNLIAGRVDSNEINYNQTTSPQYNGSYLAPSAARERFDVPTDSNIQPAADVPEIFSQWYYLTANNKLIPENNGGVQSDAA